MNDGIEPKLCSLHYTSVDKVVQRVLEYGASTQLAKFDVKSAYRSVPIYPDDRWLLGMSWKGGVYIDTVLPFRLRYAPKMCSTVADAMQWLTEGSDVQVIHYLDDFLIFGPEGEAAQSGNYCHSLENCSMPAALSDQADLSLRRAIELSIVAK